MAMSDEGKSVSNGWNVPDFRPDLAFPTLTDEMVERLRGYGQEESFAANAILFRQGDRQIDMFVVLEGGIEVCLPSAQGEPRIIARHERHAFSGELGLLNSQGSLVEGRTTEASRLLRIPREKLQRLMRAQGDIANLITSATIWRRIGIIGDANGGVVLTGRVDDAETTELKRFLLRNSYPYRMVEAPAEEAGSGGGSSDRS